MREACKPASSRLRGLVFRFAPLVALSALLAGLELALRLGGYGYSGRYLRELVVRGEPHFVPDRDYFRAFFPPNLLPSLEPLAAPVRKRPGTLRVVVMGESAALGTPDPAFSFPRVLDRMLRHRYPDLDFEVLNVSATAINSHVLADMAPRLRPLAPDLVVIYAGNNEAVGPYGPGTVFAPFLADLRLVKAGIRLGRSRAGQWVRAGWRKAAWALQPPERWAGLSMFKERAIAPGAPCLGPLYSHYRSNLDVMVAAARGMGAQVILCTVASNLRDFAPLASLPPVDPTHRDAPGTPSSTDAAGQFRLGQRLLTQSRDTEAAAAFAAARDLDALRFRADSRINALVRVAAAGGAGRGVFLADAEAAFAAHSPHGIPGRGLFHEHVHMTFTGNHLLAATVIGGVDAALLERGRIPAPPSEEPLDEEACRRELGLTGWDRLGMAEQIRGLLSQPPFADRAEGGSERERSEREADSWSEYGGEERSGEILEEYRQALEMFPEDPILRRKYGEFLSALGDLPGASRQLAAAVAAQPQDGRIRQLLARALEGRGRLPEAAEQYRLALAEDPLPELRNGLGNLLVRQGDTRGAIGQYRLALEAHPNLPEVHFNLGRAYAEADRPRDAEKAYRRALALDPAFRPAAGALAGP